MAEPLRVAVVHDWLTTFGGAERVTGELLRMWPQADLFAVIDFLPEADRHALGGRHARTTFVQRLPFARTRYRDYLPLMPLAIEQLDLRGYDVVLSSSHAVAKGVITGPKQLHVSYVHSPMRYAWDLQHEFLQLAGLRHGLRNWMARWMLHRLRIWDLRTAAGIDLMIANSRFVAARIRKAYGRRAQVVHPPVDLEAFTPRADKDDFYVTASRLVPYKRVATIVEAFAGLPDRRLVVAGDGPELDAIRRLATPNVEVMGHVPESVLRDRMQRARAFVFCAEEDFGIAPVEAQACGTPVIAYGAGGALETVRPLGTPGATGLLFEHQTPDSVRDAVRRFEAGVAPSARACRANAERFGTARFREAMYALVEDGFEHRAALWEPPSVASPRSRGSALEVEIP